MVKSQLLFIIAIVSGFLLTLQLITLQIIVRRSRPESNPVWRILYAISSAANSNDIPLFLIDPVVLAHSHNYSSSTAHDSYCKVLCTTNADGSYRKVTQLATLSEYATQLRLSKWLTELRDRGYTVFDISDVDPSYVHNDMHVSVALHVIVVDERLSQEQGHAAHIVILHPKLTNYWWSSALHLSEHQMRILYRQGVRRFNFHLFRSDSIYDKVELRPTLIDGMVLAMPSPMEAFLDNPDRFRFVECNKTRARDFFARYPLGETDVDDNNIYRHKIQKLLTKVIGLLAELDVPFWLSSGTLLGYYRQCDVFSYGLDVDIAVFIRSYNPAMIELFSVNDLPLLHVFGKPEDSYELSFRDDDLKLDVFFFYEEPRKDGTGIDHIWNGGTLASTGTKLKYIFPPFGGLCWTDFLSLKVRVPCDTLPYIEANYGKNWMEPRRSWDWAESPPNVRQNGRWPLEEWNEVIQTFDMPTMS